MQLLLISFEIWGILEIFQRFLMFAFWILIAIRIFLITARRNLLYLLRGLVCLLIVIGISYLFCLGLLLLFVTVITILLFFETARKCGLLEFIFVILVGLIWFIRFIFLYFGVFFCLLCILCCLLIFLGFRRMDCVEVLFLVRYKILDLFTFLFYRLN